MWCLRKRVFSIFIGVICCLDHTFAKDELYFKSDTINGAIPIKSWKSLRDERLVKQNLDYSCGSASIATILSEFYGYPITEAEVLDLIGKQDKASFSDMSKALKEIGFKGVGYAASYEQLTKLKIPVIVYLSYRKDDHFSVLRGIDVNTVWLADSSLGNRTYSDSQFKEMWETRENTELAGKILAILPANIAAPSAIDFFTNQPQRQTSSAVNLQAIHYLP
ncbi:MULTISPECIES: C39 family peptidase [Neptunomonas]|jgi:predicted double-glycine peptidase|uniref:Cysteine peptidase family C39 domain-containing protein n=1 Tax=Neptunomonas phycophila TaxID=1572645 RepID=A0AAW7XKC0_9GAMM|nr:MULTISPECIES: cysteine peptidase family C39 domain-containing protein [Neptunomonas]MDN2661673.1 cysteine peptidase family C39 domain-containing protein [Neptunomonas sp. CHC150]MDO6454062.1 cysteine peptidase family C39 domain-containing protein [Neptunomonas phycophila]QLE97553.1 peptidase C39 [Neptunomonas phycophila]